MTHLDSLQERLAAVLRQRESHYFDLLERMVAINSFTGNRPGIEELAGLTAEAFAGLGFRAETVAAENPAYGPHLVLTREAADAGAPRIGLVSHLDTVFTAEEEERHDFRWREDGDRIYGPGTVDIKGGTVVAYMMLDALSRVAPEIVDSATWVMLLNSAEEQVAEDFGRLCFERLGDDALACLIFEGGIMEGDTAYAVVARKGMAVFRVEAVGRAAHAGAAHARGASAVLQIADVVRRIEEWTDPERDLTFNVGVVRGGTVVNRVPHSAEAEAEMRTFRTDVYDDAMARIHSLAGYSTVRSALDGHPCEVRVEIVQKQVPWSRNPATDRLLAVWQEAGEALGLDVVAEERGGLSDGNKLWQRLPSIDGMGPSGANAHCSEQSADGSKEQEYASRSSFVPRALLNCMALVRLLAAG